MSEPEFEENSLIRRSQDPAVSAKRYIKERPTLRRTECQSWSLKKTV